MLTMRCDRCRQDKPLEAFQLSLQRSPASSNELMALERMTSQPRQLCDDCHPAPSDDVRALDILFGPGEDNLDMLLNVWDFFVHLLKRALRR